MSENKGDSAIVLEEKALIAQHDWFNTTRNPEEDGSFFVSLKKYGSPIETINAVQKGGQLRAESHDMVIIQKMDGRRLKVNAADFGTSTFYAPRIEFNTMHSSSVHSVDVSCTGRLIVSSDANGELAVWHSETAEIIRKFEGHVMDVNKCRFFPSGLVVLSGGLDMTVRVWSVETGQCPRIFKGHHRPVVDLAIIGRGKEVMSSSKDGSVMIWNCGSAQCVRNFQPNCGAANALSLSSTGEDCNTVAIAMERGMAKIYDFRASDDTVVNFSLTGEEGTAISFNDEGADRLYVGTSKGNIFEFDIRTNGLTRKLITMRSAVTRLLSSKSHGLLISFGDGTVCSYKVPFGSPTSTLEFSGADCDPIYDFALYDDKYLYTACRDRIVRKYEIL